MQFDHYNVRHGISQGSQSGLNRFDSYEFQIFNSVPFEPGTITNTLIYDITEGPGGQICAGTKGGLNRYDKNDGLVVAIPHREEGSVISDDFVFFSRPCIKKAPFSERGSSDC